MTIVLIKLWALHYYLQKNNLTTYEYLKKIKYSAPNRVSPQNSNCEMSKKSVSSQEDAVRVFKQPTSENIAPSQKPKSEVSIKVKQMEKARLSTPSNKSPSHSSNNSSEDGSPKLKRKNSHRSVKDRSFSPDLSPGNKAFENFETNSRTIKKMFLNQNELKEMNLDAKGVPESNKIAFSEEQKNGVSSGQERQNSRQQPKFSASGDAPSCCEHDENFAPLRLKNYSYNLDQLRKLSKDTKTLQKNKSMFLVRSKNSREQDTTRDAANHQKMIQSINRKRRSLLFDPKARREPSSSDYSFLQGTKSENNLGWMRRRKSAQMMTGLEMNRNWLGCKTIFESEEDQPRRGLAKDSNNEATCGKLRIKNICTRKGKQKQTQAELSAKGIRDSFESDEEVEVRDGDGYEDEPDILAEVSLNNSEDRQLSSRVVIATQE